ncbi:MAG: putative rane protein [Bacteroidota bacterium]
MAAMVMFLPQYTISQTSSRLDSLYKLQRKLDREISKLTQTRDSVRLKTANSQTELKLITEQVVLREELLEGLQSQMSELEKQIENTSTVILSLEADMRKIQEQFGRLLVVTYKAFQNSNTSFYLLSSSSIAQGYRRMQHFKAIQRMQSTQMKLLKRTKAFLSQKRMLLAQQKLDQERVVLTEQMEKAKLLALKQEQKQVISRLKADETALAKELQQNQSARAKLAEEIKKELDRIRKAKNDKIKTARKEEIDILNQLNKDFSSNKGKFPWPIPIPNAKITRHFGRQTLPGSNTEIDVQGIDLTTVPNQPVRAIFGGVVESVMSIPGQGKMVIVSHGTFYSVYANLATVAVKAQDKVSNLGHIGTARTDPASGETKLYFQMNQDKTSLDPEIWLVKKGL